MRRFGVGAFLLVFGGMVNIAQSMAADRYGIPDRPCKAYAPHGKIPLSPSCYIKVEGERVRVLYRVSRSTFLYLDSQVVGDDAVEYKTLVKELRGRGVGSQGAVVFAYSSTFHASEKSQICKVLFLNNWNDPLEAAGAVDLVPDCLEFLERLAAAVSMALTIRFMDPPGDGQMPFRQNEFIRGLLVGESYAVLPRVPVPPGSPAAEFKPLLGNATLASKIVVTPYEKRALVAEILHPGVDSQWSLASQKAPKFPETVLVGTELVGADGALIGRIVDLIVNRNVVSGVLVVLPDDLQKPIGIKISALDRQARDSHSAILPYAAEVIIPLLKDARRDPTSIDRAFRRE